MIEAPSNPKHCPFFTRNLIHAVWGQVTQTEIESQRNRQLSLGFPHQLLTALPCLLTSAIQGRNESGIEDTYLTQLDVLTALTSRHVIAAVDVGFNVDYSLTRPRPREGVSVRFTIDELGDPQARRELCWSDFSRTYTVSPHRQPGLVGNLFHYFIDRPYYREREVLKTIRPEGTLGCRHSVQSAEGARDAAQWSIPSNRELLAVESSLYTTLKHNWELSRPCRLRLSEQFIRVLAGGEQLVKTRWELEYGIALNKH